MGQETQKQGNDTDNQILKQKKKLEQLLQKVKNEYGGKIPNRVGYLKKDDGKQILTLVATLFDELGGWNKVTKLLKRSQSSIKVGFSIHGIKKKRSVKKHTGWESCISLLKEFFVRSHKMRRSSEELEKLKKEMLDAIEACRGERLSFNSVRMVAKDKPWKNWGMSGAQQKKNDTEVFMRIINDDAMSYEEKRAALFESLPQYNNNWTSVKKRMRSLGFSLPYHTPQKTKSCWDNSALVERIRQMIEQEHVLVQGTVDDGIKKILAGIREQFAEIIDNSDDAFNIAILKVKLDELIWTPKVDKALQEVVRTLPEPEKEFMPLFSYIPATFVQKRTRWHRGVSHSNRLEARRALPGIGRVRTPDAIKGIRNFQIPQTDFKKPCILFPDSHKDNFSISFLNGANIGTRYGGDIVGNVVRRALSDADNHGDEAIIATNLISIDLKKAAGPLKVARSLAMGDNVNLKVFADLEYRDKVERIMDKKPVDEIIYQTVDELLDNVLSGWEKICIKPNDKPEYKGPIFIVLGRNEEELIRTIAYWEMRYWTIRKQNELQARVRVVAAALVKAEENGDDEEIKEFSTRIATLTEQLNRTVVSNIATQESQRFYKLAQAIVVHKIENAIPNSKIIGQGVTYIKIENKMIAVDIPRHDRANDTLLADFTGKNGPKILKEKLAPTTILCHPWSLNSRSTVNETDYNGKRGSAKIIVAPTLVDDDFLREALKDTTHDAHPLAKAVFNEQFSGGMLRLTYTNGKFDQDIIPISALGAHEKQSGKKKSRRKKTLVQSFYVGGPKYIWVHTGTDPHEGGRAKEWVRCKNTGKRFGMSDAVFEMMRREGLCKNNNMPVHVFSVNDDPTQAQNFPARTQPDPHQFPPYELHRRALELLKQGSHAKDKKGTLDALEKMEHLLVHQSQRRGTDFPHEQMFEMLERYVTPNIDVFSAILRRAKKSGVIIKGVGDFVNTEYDGFDTRNVGIINLGSGNHLAHTVGGEIIEGPFYALHAKNLLVGLPEWQKDRDFVLRHVIAPSYSGEAIAWGTIRVNNGYEYGLEIRSSPPRMAGWRDPLLGAVRNDLMRGNYSRIFNGRLTLKTYGDKHRFGTVITSYAIYHMCASGTRTDRYGERGFSPNNTGVSFIGLPAEGPDSGPILERLLPYDVIKDFVEDNPRTFDWEKFLPNPA